MDELVQLLGWRDPAQHDRRCAALERAHVTAVAGKLDAKLDRATRAMLGSVANDRYFAILRGAETFHAAYFGAASDLAPRVQRWVAVELAAPGAETRLDGRIGSASLDRYVHARDRRVLAIELLPWVRTTQIAIEISGKLLDRAQLPIRRHDTATVDEYVTAVDRIERGLRLLRAVSPPAADLALRFGSLVTLRSSTTDPRFLSAGDPTRPGVIHMINAHLPTVTDSDVATALVRETVNQALYRWELEHVLLQTAEDVLVPSPWTARALSLYGFVHACFAWYAVGSLWSLRMAPNEGASWVDEAAAGFAQRPLDSLGELARHLPTAVADAIAYMTRDFAPAVARRTSRG